MALVTIKRAARSIARRADFRRQRGTLFGVDEIQTVCDAFFEYGSAQGTPWDKYREAHLRLPEWFVHGLDPLSDAYARQQEILWKAIAGVDRDYSVPLDEAEHELGVIDTVRFPGYYLRRDDQAIASASDHVLASGMILKHSGLKAGDHALEYGAGFGQTSLALARLGVNVDTVDVSAVFCNRVAAQAEFFGVPLRPFHAEFGFNPRPAQKYDLIFFYESFHHCVNFMRVLPKLKEMLAPRGRILLTGEPIGTRENTAVPYPWGLRLHSEVVAVVRKLHWFEMGFSESFLFRIFRMHGFAGYRIDCPPSLFGRTHTFQLSQ